MKKDLFILLALLNCAFLKAQTCTTTWPYLYPDFKQGTVYLGGGVEKSLLLNLHLLKTRLHYVDNGIVKEAYLSGVDSVRIGDDFFRFVNGLLMKVEKADSSGFVACLFKADFTVAVEGSGAYGMPASTIAISEYSSLDVTGGANQNHMLLLENKRNGKTVDIEKEYYVVAPPKAVVATRRAFGATLESKAEKKDFNAFLKANRIEWDEPESLLLLTRYVR